MSQIRRHSQRWLLTALIGIVLIAVGFGAGTLMAQSGVSSKVMKAFTSAPAEACPAHPRYVKWSQPVRGITFSGLQDFVLTSQTVTMMERQERAAKNYWKANHVRIQILQDRLVGHNGKQWNSHYFYYVRKVIDYAIGIGLSVDINDQTEVSVGYADNEPGPTYATKMFWLRMMNYWTNNPKVDFDLFNEPRNMDWNVWKNGGSVAGFPDHYIGEQALVSYIRKEGAQNQIWVEGINWGSTLAGVPMLKGGNIVYTFHHPGSPHPEEDVVPGPAVWDPSFGCLAARGVKVLDGEFANYVGNFYWVRHPGASVRRYLAYLQAHHVGVECWTLTAGSLNANADYMTVSKEPQGDGQIIRQFFMAQAHAEYLLASKKRR